MDGPERRAPARLIHGSCAEALRFYAKTPGGTPKHLGRILHAHLERDGRAS